jgi:hypothetical protein
MAVNAKITLQTKKFHKQTVANFKKKFEIFLKKFLETRILTIFLKISEKNSCSANVSHISNF